MKKSMLIISALLVSIGSSSVFADKWVNDYTKKDGTYVQGYYRSSPDSYRYNNRGSQTYGGRQRDEYSSGRGATNRSNSSWDWRDNDNDGVINSYDWYPESGRN